MSAWLSHIASAGVIQRSKPPALVFSGTVVSLWLQSDSDLLFQQHTVCICVVVCVSIATRRPQRWPCHSVQLSIPPCGCRDLWPRFHIATAILKEQRAKVWCGQCHKRCWEKWLILSTERTETARHALGEENYKSIKITQKSTLSAWPWGEKESESASWREVNLANTFLFQTRWLEHILNTFSRSMLKHFFQSP